VSELRASTATRYRPRALRRPVETFSRRSVVFVSAADNLRNQRKLTITGLMPATEYQVQVEGHNAAGSTVAEYYFFTLTEDGGNVPCYARTPFRVGPFRTGAILRFPRRFLHQINFSNFKHIYKLKCLYKRIKKKCSTYVVIEQLNT